MSELGRIEVIQKLGCPNCHHVFGEKCQDLQSEGELFRCPHCHQKLRLPKPRSLTKVTDSGQDRVVLASQLPCPTCTHTLSPLTLSHDYQVIIDHCSHCGGLWFDYLELQDALHDPKLCAQLVLPKPTLTGLDQTKSRSCPRCRNTILEPRIIDDVEIDECPICRGSWLDAGEVLELIKLQPNSDLPSSDTPSFIQRFFSKLFRG